MRLQPKRIAIGFWLVSLFFSSVVLSFFYFNLTKIKVEGRGVDPSKEGVFPSPNPQDTYNLVLLGYGGHGHDGGSLSDTIIVCHLDFKKKLAAFISVPRDLWVPIPIRSDIKKNFKINAAFAIGNDDVKYPLKEPRFKGEAGGGELAKEVVGLVVGMPIDYFLAVDFEGFKKAVDVLGGVEVEVPVSFDDYFYPVAGLENEICGKSAKEITELHQKYSGFQLEKQFVCRYEHLHFDKGRQLMDGETALKFVRSRHSSEHGGDFARHERQQAVLSAIKERILSLENVDKMIGFFNQLSGIIRTDLDAAFVKETLKAHPRPSEFSISNISLSEENVLRSEISSNGQFILVPRAGLGEWDEVHQYIISQLKP